MYVARGNFLFRVKEILKDDKKKKRGRVVILEGLAGATQIRKTDRIFSRKPSRWGKD